MNSQIGKIILIIGLILVVAGLYLLFFHQKWHLFQWFGNLPGDIKVEKPKIKIYFPVVSLIIISVVINVAILIIKKIFHL